MEDKALNPELAAELETLRARLAMDRAADLAASRLAALNMMEDAVEARNRLETANQELQREMAERKQMMEALRKSEDHYRSLFQNMLNGFAYCRMIFDQERPQDFIYLEVNRAFESLTGLKNVVGRKASEVIPGIQESDAELLKIYGGVALTGKSEYFEYYLAALKMWFSISVYSPQKEHFVAVFDVITERKRAEEALRASEERFRRAVVDSPFPMLLHAEDGAILQASNSWCEISGYSRAELLTIADWTERAYGERRARVQADIEALYGLGQRKAEGDYTIRTKSGGTRIWEFSSAPLGRLPDGRRTVISMAMDVTERRAAEQEVRQLNAELEQRVQQRTAAIEAANQQLRDEIAVRQQAQQAQARLVSMLEATTDFVGYADAQSTRILYINRAGRRMTGYGEEEDVTGLSIRDVHPDWANQMLRDEALPAAARDGVWTGECAFRARDGHEIPVLMVLLAHQTPNGEVEVFSTISRDITELRRVRAEIESLNEALKTRAAQLEAANQELEAFSYSVSHDLRAPLRGIDGWAQALAEDFGEKLGEAGLQLLNRQRAASQRMGTLIDDLLQLSWLSRQPLTCQTVSPATLVSRVWEELHLAQPPQTAELVVGALPDCQADPSLLTQVFVNLLGNALKFSRGHPQPRIEVGSQAGPDHECVYFVKDNGAGFDMRYANKLFGAFQRLHSAHDFPGTGIGLAITQRIIHRHGGRIWAEGKVNEGATFFFTLNKEMQNGE